MEDNTFMMVSMKDSKTVADALSNKTAQKILNYLTENKEATESELSEKLDIPLPTIHYNIQQLKKANLVKSKEFFWSKKGKKMRIFTLAKKFIIISPDSDKSTLSKLKDLLPVTLLSFIGAGIIKIYQSKKYLATNKAADALNEMAAKTFTNMTQTQTTLQEPNYALWFLAGSLFVIILTFLFRLKNR